MSWADTDSIRTNTVRWLTIILGLTASAAFGGDPPHFRRELFNGQSLHGWIASQDCEVDLVDQCLRLKSGAGWVRHETRLRDFELKLEWKILKPSDDDAGIYVRCSSDSKSAPENGYRISLRQGHEGAIASIPRTDKSGLAKPAGEWNSLELLALKNSMQLKINGRISWCVTDLSELDGWFGLQAKQTEGGQFLFRNITVKEWNYNSLFNGRDLAGWEGVGGAAEECWSVVDGLLTCSGKKGPWLRSAFEYGNFNLRLEYRLSDGGNSGVYVRVPSDGNHHREDETQPPAGFEIQVLDDSAPQYANLKDFQYSASIYDLAGAKPRVSRPVGEWNSLEINCVGQHVTTWHNGFQTTDITGETVPALNLRSTSGFLGLQNHNTIVSFRNIRLGPANKLPTATSESN